MSNISSFNTWQIKLMRWVARILSIPWAFWALFLTYFLVAQPNKEGEYLPTVVLTIILSISALMYIGAAIIASVWGKEAFGGYVLLVDGILILAWVIATASKEFVITTVLPPLVAGLLFLVCHRKSKRQKAQHT